MKGSTCSRFSVMSFGLAMGVTWGLGMMFLGMMVSYMGMGEPMLDMMASVYQGFDSSLKGSLIGGAWGFVDGFFGGFIFALLYNMFLRCKCCCKAMCGSDDKKD